MGFLASILAVLDDEPLPEGFVVKETPDGVRVAFALFSLPDPPVIVPPAPEMFEGFAAVDFNAGSIAAGSCPVRTVLFLPGGVENVGFFTSSILARTLSRSAL